MSVDWVCAENTVGRVAIDPSIGNIRALEFRVGDRRLSPLHTAPWVDHPEVTRDGALSPVEARLAGDFFCAPFAASDVENAPAHGWSANSPWLLTDSSDSELTLQLERRIMGACITKTLALAADAPLLFQTHVIDGGDGAIPVAHHPMIRMAGRGRMSTSPKRAAITFSQPIEAGRNRLAMGQRVENTSLMQAKDGDQVDIFDLPIGDCHEDFVTLVEAQESALGWTAILREVEDDIIFVLKDPETLPVTMLWHSNGGRDYAPWNGKHRGVIGIEDGCAAGAEGHRAALAANSVAAEGVPTALELGGSLRIRHVIGAIPRPDGWTCVKSITADANQLTLTDVKGASHALPFNKDFLKKEP